MSVLCCFDVGYVHVDLWMMLLSGCSTRRQSLPSGCVLQSAQSASKHKCRTFSPGSLPPLRNFPWPPLLYIKKSNAIPRCNPDSNSNPSRLGLEASRVNPVGFTRFQTSLRTLSAYSRRLVRSIPTCTTWSQTKSVGPCSGIQKRHVQTRPAIVFCRI